MDTDERTQKGGSVEPANRAAVARQVFQTPKESAGPRYELRDPFAEVTYRVESFEEMVAKADRLGATRFHAVAQNGSRTAIDKSNGEWKQPGVTRSKQLALEGNESAETPKIDPRMPSPAPSSGTETVVAKIDGDAERAARVARLEAALFERYVVKRSSIKVGDLAVGQTEYRYRGDANRVAFTETTFRLATETNNPSVARSMVDVAEARGWQGVRVSGNEDFKRMVWLEASLRGVKTLGYEAQLADHELMKREREARAVNRVEPVRTDGRGIDSNNTAETGKQSARGGGGRKAVLVALEAVLIAKGVPTKQREAVMDAAAANLAQRLRSGEIHKVKVFDKTAPAQQPRAVPLREMQRAQERAAPTR